MAVCVRFLPVLLLVATLLPRAAEGYTTDEIVDLSWNLITDNTLYWPEWPYAYDRLDILEVAGDGYWATAYGFKMSIHTGTHIDVPCHVRAQEEGAMRMHEVPIERFFGPGCVIDVSEKVAADREYRVTMEDVEAWEEEHGRIPDGAVVLVHFGWARTYGDDPEGYWGTMNMSTPELLSYPSIRPEVSQFLVDERNINAVGTDSGTPDHPGEAGSHLAILGKERIIVENISARLELLPPTGYRIHVVPLPLYDTCGAPVRLLAFKEPEEEASGAGRVGAGWVGLMVGVMGVLISGYL